MSDGSSRSIDVSTLRRDQLRGLLSLAAAPETLDALAASHAPAETAVQLLADASGDVAIARSLLETVLSPDTPVAALRGVKEAAKQLGGRAATPAARTAATFLYLAAIAAAAQQGENISSVPLAERAEAYARLAASLAADPLGRLFATAAALAEQAGGQPPA